MFISDVLLAALDPRIRLTGGAAKGRVCFAAPLTRGA
jgi:hypothetical protein